MKFRKMACGCCKSDHAAKLCKSPTYVISEVTDNSNVIFLLMNKLRPGSCGGALALGTHASGDETRAVVRAGGGPFEDPAAAPTPRSEAILDSCWRPASRLAENDDFEEGDTSILRNRRLLAEGSKFWPRRRNRDADSALREWE